MIRLYWAAIEADLQDIGVDVGDAALLRSRSWRWLQARIVGLITRPASRYLPDGTPLPVNRLQLELNGRDRDAGTVSARRVEEG